MKDSETTPRNGFTRREMLYLGLTAAVLSRPLSALAQSSSESNAANGLELLTELSQSLTGHSDLSATSAERIYKGLSEQQSDLTAALSDLASVSKQDPASWSEEQTLLARKILKAWYLGTLDQGDSTAVIAYEHALMFRPVATELMPRTFCYRNPGYWAERPEAA